MKRVAFIYPFLTSYSIPVLKGIAESGRVQLEIIHGIAPAGEGFGEQVPFVHPNVQWIQVEERRLFGDQFGLYQSGILSYLIKKRPDAVWIGANPRYLSFWGVLLAGQLLGIPVYARGHGLFKKKHVGFLHRVMYKAILALSHTYVCYTPAVKESLVSLVKSDNKLVVDFNTLYNQYPVAPERRTGNEPGIFYIGRVRSGCGVNVLIEAVKSLNDESGLNIELYIIGDGPLGSLVHQEAEKHPWLHYYGALFDQKRISEISENCRIGCVPGFMGLNVVHMLSLSLPVLTHGQLKEHMGPEPEYIQHKVNGWFINEPNDSAALKAALRELWRMPSSEIKIMQENAKQTYEKISNPPFHERHLLILEQ